MLGHLLQYAVLILPIISGIGASACNGEEEHCSVHEQKRLLHTRGQLGMTMTSDGVQMRSWKTSVTGDFETCIFVTNDTNADCESEAQTLTQNADERGGPEYVVNNWAICKYMDGKLQEVNGQLPQPCIGKYDSPGSGFSCMACFHYTDDNDQKPPTNPPTQAPDTPAPTPVPVPPTPAPVPQPPTLAPFPAYVKNNLLQAADSTFQFCTLHAATTANTEIVVWPSSTNPTDPTFQWYWNPSDFTIRFATNPSLCINADGGTTNPGRKLMLFPCSPLTVNMQFVSWSDGSIRFKFNTAVGFNVNGGLGNNHNLQTFTLSSPPAVNEKFWMGSLPPSHGDGLIKIKNSPTFCLNMANFKYDNGAELIAYSCSPLTENMRFQVMASDQTIRPQAAPTQCLDIDANANYAANTKIVTWECNGGDNQKFVFESDGSIRSAKETNMGLNMQGGISDNNNDKNIILYPASPVTDNMMFTLSTDNPTALAVVMKLGYVCGNRGSIGGTGCCSKKVTSLESCANAVATNPSCGTEFSWSQQDQYCDCVPAAEGPCVPATDANTVQKQYNLYTFSPYFYMKWHMALCLNRGSVGGTPPYSANKPSLQACAAHVAAEPLCGQEFSYGGLDHWCDCVPSGEGPCTYYTDAGTQQNKYSVYTLAS